MSHLLNFPSPPAENYVTVCEKDGQLQHVLSTSSDSSVFMPVLTSYPTIHVTKDTLRPTASKESARAAFLPSEEPPLKKALHLWYEQGVTSALEELAGASIDDGVYSWIPLIAQCCLKVTDSLTAIKNAVLMERPMAPGKLIMEYSENRDWANGIIRCIAWHPHCIKLAVALRDDYIHIHSSGSSLFPVLKHRSQKSVACMAWKPFSASELAVGCLSGILIWQVNPNSIATRPTSNAMCLLSRSGHSPVTSLAWHPQGSLLISASSASTTMYIWDVATTENVPLKRIGGGGVSLVVWSPDGSHVFSATPSSILRVWETHAWGHERWNTMEGNVQAAAWSPCGTILLFSTSKEPFIYSIHFSAVGGEDPSGYGAKSAVPVVDTTRVRLDNGGVCVGGAIQNLCWDATGERLAVSFKNSPLIAIFRTKITPTLQISPCGFVQGSPGEETLLLSFQPNFKSGALLAIAWSSGRIQYLPLIYSVGNTSHNDSLHSHSFTNYSTSFCTSPQQI